MSHHDPIRAALIELRDAVEGIELEGVFEVDEALAAARAALATPPTTDEPAVPQEGREPAAVAPDIRGLIERVARMGDRIGLATVREIMEISDQAAAWLQENPPGRPTAPAPAEGEVGELVAKLRRLSCQNPLGTADPTITRAAALLQQQATELATLRAGVPVAGWLPIDNAPKDGTEILASDYDAIEIVSWKVYGSASNWESRYGDVMFPAWWQPLADHPPTPQPPRGGEVEQ